MLHAFLFHFSFGFARNDDLLFTFNGCCFFKFLIQLSIFALKFLGVLKASIRIAPKK